MKKVWIGVTFLVAVATVAASAASSPMNAVNQFITAFNKGDMNGAAAICTTSSVVIDDFPPHAWQGGNACAAWARDFVAFSAKHGDANAIVTLAKPAHVDITGDRAYVVVPATYSFKEHGKPITEKGSTFTVALQNGARGWRITGWSWSDGRQP